jgi:NADH-quinone oxidoreductase subunit J
MIVEQVVLIIAGALALVSALGVVLMPNAVYSAMMLLLNLVSLATIFLLLHAQFMFAAQLVVYAGAILVLFLFVVTLLNPQGENILRDKHRLQQAGAITLGLVLACALVGGLLYAFTSGTQPDLATGVTQTGSNYGTVEAFGKALFTQFLLPFELTSLLLLVALIGAVVLGKRK